MKNQNKYLIVAASPLATLLQEALIRYDSDCIIIPMESLASWIDPTEIAGTQCVFIHFSNVFSEEFLQLKHALLSQPKPVPIVGIVSEDFEQVAVRMIKLGFIDAIITPQSFSHLDLEKVMSSVSHHEHVEKKEIYRFLIVDDDEIDRRVMRLAIGKCRLKSHCDETSSAEEALNYLAHNEYDGVLLDYNLPGMDGIEFTERALKAGYKIPIILIVSGRISEKIAVMSMIKGASAYIAKADLTPEYLDKILISAFHLHQGETLLRRYIAMLEKTVG